jgi:hypothetical protein
MAESNTYKIESASQPDESMNLDLTPEEERDVEIKNNQQGMSRFEAEWRVIGLERTCARRGLSLEEGRAMLVPDYSELEQQPQPNGDDNKYPGRNPYKSPSNSGEHPIKISQRQRTIGDANSGDPHLR